MAILFSLTVVFSLLEEIGIHPWGTKNQHRVRPKQPFRWSQDIKANMYATCFVCSNLYESRWVKGEIFFCAVIPLRALALSECLLIFLFTIYCTGASLTPFPSPMCLWFKMWATLVYSFEASLVYFPLLCTLVPPSWLEVTVRYSLHSWLHLAAAAVAMRKGEECAK